MNHLSFDLIRFPDVHKASTLIQGGGQNGLIAIIKTATNTTETDLEYLEKIAGAIGLAPIKEKLCWISLAEETLLPLTGLCQYKEMNKVLFFGYPPALAGIRAQLPSYQWQRIGDFHYLYVDQLDTIRKEREAGKNEKARALWAALQAIPES